MYDTVRVGKYCAATNLKLVRYFRWQSLLLKTDIRVESLRKTVQRKYFQGCMSQNIQNYHGSSEYPAGSLFCRPEPLFPGNVDTAHSNKRGYPLSLYFRRSAVFPAHNESSHASDTLTHLL